MSTRVRGQIILTVVVLLAWEFAPVVFDLNPLVLPRLSSVIVRLGAPLTGEGTLWSNTVTTVVEVAAAFVIAAVAGVVVGVPIGLLPRVRRLVLPLLTAAFAVPIMVLIPLFLVSFGLGMESKVTFGALYGFFPVLFNTVVGAGNVDKVYFEVADAFGLSAADRLRKIVLRSASRSILNGLQISLAIVIIAVISIEMFGSVAGLGYLIHRAGQRMRMDEVYALILVVLVVAWLLLSLVKLGARLLNVRLEMSTN